MKLRQDQVLLLHNIVFHFLNTADSVSFKDDAEDVLRDLREHLLSSGCSRSSESDEVEDFDEEDLDDEEDDEWSHVQDCVYADDLVELPVLTVSQFSNLEKGKLIFFGGPPVSFDFEDGNRTLESADGVRFLTRRSKELILASKDETWTFKVGKFPKEWTSLLEVNKPYRID